MTDKKVLVIGLDAACLERIEPHIEDGALPNLADLMADGVSEPMETTTPPWTPSAWPSVVTGSRPWTHGVYDFYHYGDGEPDYVTAREVRVPFLWEILSAAGYSSIVVNVPVTHPVHTFHGSLVPGYIAPEGADCLVAGQPVSMATLGDSYRIYPSHDGSDSGRLREYVRLIASRVDVAERLANDHPWSFMMVQFQSTDAVFHSMGDHPDGIRRVYRAVDEAVGRLRDLAGGSAHVFVVSDHGMHRYDRIFHCNTWLRNRDLLETTSGTSRRAWNEHTRTDLTDESVKYTTAERVLRGTIRGMQRLGVTPRSIEHLLSRVGLDDLVLRFLPESVLVDAVESSDHVDWERSKAYCRSSSSLGIRCNVESRDAGGVVPAEEFEELRERLVDRLNSLTTPDGEPVFERVYDRHRVHGSDVANERSAPDIVLRPTGMSYEVSDVLRERTFTPTREFNHSYRGLFVAAGENIDPTADCDPQVVDVTPTVLALFGLSAPATADGGVLDETLVDLPAPRENPAIGEREFYDSSGEQDVDDGVEEQLRRMGYIQ